MNHLIQFNNKVVNYNEKVDIYVMRSAPYGEWKLLDTVETDTHGRIRYTIPIDKKLSLGLHPVKLVVR